MDEENATYDRKNSSCMIKRFHATNVLFSIVNYWTRSSHLPTTYSKICGTTKHAETVDELNNRYECKHEHKKVCIPTNACSKSNIEH